jgi:hypothetical protein
MEITTAMLCESASLRDNLINIRGGGVLAIERPAYPAALGLTLAVIAVLDDTERTRDGQPIEILLCDENGDVVNKATTTFGADSELPGRVAVPLAFRLADMAVPGIGTYGVMVESNGEVLATLVFSATLG